MTYILKSNCCNAIQRLNYYITIPNIHSVTLRVKDQVKSSYLLNSSYTDASQVQRVNSFQLHSFLKEAAIHINKSGLRNTLHIKICSKSDKLEFSYDIYLFKQQGCTVSVALDDIACSFCILYFNKQKCYRSNREHYKLQMSTYQQYRLQMMYNDLFVTDFFFFCCVR